MISLPEAFINFFKTLMCIAYLFLLFYSIKNTMNTTSDERNSAMEVPYKKSKNYIELFVAFIFFLTMFYNLIIPSIIILFILFLITFFIKDIKCEECGSKSFKHQNYNFSYRYFKCQKCGKLYKQKISAKERKENITFKDDVVSEDTVYLAPHKNKVTTATDIFLLLVTLIVFFIAAFSFSLEFIFIYILFLAIINYIHYYIHIIHKCPDCKKSKLAKLNSGVISAFQYLKCNECGKIYKQKTSIFLAINIEANNKNNSSSNIKS